MQRSLCDARKNTPLCCHYLCPPLVILSEQTEDVQLLLLNQTNDNSAKSNPLYLTSRHWLTSLTSCATGSEVQELFPHISSLYLYKQQQFIPWAGKMTWKGQLLTGLAQNSITLWPLNFLMTSPELQDNKNRNTASNKEKRRLYFSVKFYSEELWNGGWNLSSSL